MQRLRGTFGARAIGRGLLPFPVMGFCLWVLAQNVEMSVFSALPGMLNALPADLVAMSAAFCALSFWAVARYDCLAHRHFQTGIADGVARKSGFAAIAIAQTAGFGILTGAAVRWRMMPDLGFAMALKLSTFVSISFMLALGYLTALACLVLAGPDWTLLPARVIALGLPLAVIAISFTPAVAALRHRLPLPSLTACLAILSWATFDILAAGTALWLLIPDTDLSLAVFLPAFLLALGAAMLSGAPGGMGPFELVLVSLLPQVPFVDLAAGIVAFRALYYAVPAVIGAALTLTPARARIERRQDVCPSMSETGNPELAVLAQNGGRQIHHSDGAFALWPTTQTATLLFDPIAGHASVALRALQREAVRANRLPAVYKCGPRTAVAARRSGWAVCRIAEDCLVDPKEFDISRPACRTLRRKIRKASAAGVTVSRTRAAPIARLARIDADWQTQNGVARGGSMGRFCPDYLSRQDVYIAWRDGTAIAFVTFNRGHDGLCLDLMRHARNVPDGTMHLLVLSAIERAGLDRFRSVSLAALPSAPPALSRLPILAPHFEARGLRQFKTSFAPTRHIRYAAAPTHLALAIALADIASEIHFPRPLFSENLPHNQDEDYELASSMTL